MESRTYFVTYFNKAEQVIQLNYTSEDLSVALASKKITMKFGGREEQYAINEVTLIEDGVNSTTGTYPPKIVNISLSPIFS